MIKAVIFDWGGTVMRVFPQYPGPMAEWPQVEPVPGIAEALQSLQNRYVLALATNAADSGEALVRRALRRVDLDRYFEQVLTARELGARKPDPAFFQVAAHVLECRPEQAVMVGDDYDADVMGAIGAGLTAVWYNPAALPRPRGHVHEAAEITSMTELPSALALLDHP